MVLAVAVLRRWLWLSLAGNETTQRGFLAPALVA
jgi:hypothetical protein